MTTVCTIGDEVRVQVSEWTQRTGIVRFIGQKESRLGIHYGIKWTENQYNQKESIHLYVPKESILEVLKKATTLRVTVGDLVWIDKKNCRAMVRFIGYTTFGTNQESDIWYGLQLEQRKGKNDGSINGKRYFHCLPKYGLFVKAPQITPDYHISSDLYNKKQYDAQEVQVVMILQKWLRMCHGFSYDVGNKYHTISSIGIVRMIKSFAFQQYDTVSATTQSFFKLNDLNPWERLFKSLKGVSYTYIDDKKNWVAIELYLNDERECKWVQKGSVGTWDILEKEQKIHMKFTKTKCIDDKTSSSSTELYLSRKDLENTMISMIHS